MNVRGNKNKCPLCRNILPVRDEADCDEVDIYPEIPPSFQRNLAIQIMAFISIAAIVASFVLYQIFPSELNWPMFELLGLISMWLSLIVVLRKRRNIPKTIMWQVLIVSGLSVIWDWKIGYRGWSLDYAIPIICVSAMLVMFVTAKVMNLGVGDYISYLLLDGIFGIIPIIFILLDLVEVFYPSAICVALSIIFLSAIIIFQGESIKIELIKRLHI